MNLRTTIEIIAEDKLTRHAFTFYFLTTVARELVLDEYVGQTRRSTRHKFRTVTSWHRLSHRLDGTEIVRALVPLTPAIAAQARSQFLADILTGVEGETLPIPEYVWVDTAYDRPEKDEPWGMCGVVRKSALDAAPRTTAGIPILNGGDIIAGYPPGYDNFELDEDWAREAAKRMEGWIPPEKVA